LPTVSSDNAASYSIIENSTIQAGGAGTFWTTATTLTVTKDLIVDRLQWKNIGSVSGATTANQEISFLINGQKYAFQTNSEDWDYTEARIKPLILRAGTVVSVSVYYEKTDGANKRWEQSILLFGAGN